MNLISFGKPNGFAPNSDDGFTELKIRTKHGKIITNANENKITWLIKLDRCLNLAIATLIILPNPFVLKLQRNLL